MTIGRFLMGKRPFLITKGRFLITIPRECVGGADRPQMLAQNSACSTRFTKRWARSRMVGPSRAGLNPRLA